MWYVGVQHFELYLSEPICQRRAVESRNDVFYIHVRCCWCTIWNFIFLSPFLHANFMGHSIADVPFQTASIWAHLAKFVKGALLNPEMMCHSFWTSLENLGGKGIWTRFYQIGAFPVECHVVLKRPHQVRPVDNARQTSTTSLHGRKPRCRCVTSSTEPDPKIAASITELCH